MVRNLGDHLEAVMHVFDEAWASIAPTIDPATLRIRSRMLIEREVVFGCA